MAEEVTTQQIVAFKRKIDTEYPGAARNFSGVDKIFYMKTPGDDAVISGNGTVIIRKGWGAATHPTRYGNIVEADRVLRSNNYKPYNIYQDEQTFREYEAQHKQAKFQKEQQQLVFSEGPAVPKITRSMKRDDFRPRQLQLDYSSVNIPVSQQFNQRQLVPKQLMKTAQNPNYSNIIDSIGDPLKKMSALNSDIFAQSSGLGPMMFRNMSENEFAAYSKKSYSNVRSLEKQLGIPSFAGDITGTKSNKGKKEKNKKGGATDEYNL